MTTSTRARGTTAVISAITDVAAKRIDDHIMLLEKRYSLTQKLAWGLNRERGKWTFHLNNIEEATPQLVLIRVRGMAGLNQFLTRVDEVLARKYGTAAGARAATGTRRAA